MLAPDGQLEALRLLVDHRDLLSNPRVATVNRLRRLLAGLIPGKAKKDITALQAKAILASVRPRDVVGKTRRRVAADELANLMAIEKRVKAPTTTEIKAIVKERGSNLMRLSGVGPVVAGRILADVGDVARFADRNRFASWTGTVPSTHPQANRPPTSPTPGAGNRRMNRMIHIAATTQIRLDTEGRTYYQRKLAAGKTRVEAMRCVKRRISDAVYRQLIADSAASETQGAGTGPGGHCGASLTSSAVDLHPHIDTSDQPLPGPANPTPQPTSRGRKITNARAHPVRRRTTCAPRAAARAGSASAASCASTSPPFWAPLPT